MGFGVWGLGFGVWGLGFRAYGLGFRAGEGFVASLPRLKWMKVRLSDTLNPYKQTSPSCGWGLGFRI